MASIDLEQSSSLHPKPKSAAQSSQESIPRWLQNMGSKEDFEPFCEDVTALARPSPACTNSSESSIGASLERVMLFKKLWKHSTEDNNLMLYGFRRFKTSHLLNLRYLEDEISNLDHQIYQIGLHSGCELGERDRLGLRYSKRDSAPPEKLLVSQELVLKLRHLIIEYGKLRNERERRYVTKGNR
jgi:hypothetical protein